MHTRFTRAAGLETACALRPRRMSQRRGMSCDPVCGWRFAPLTLQNLPSSRNPQAAAHQSPLPARPFPGRPARSPASTWVASARAARRGRKLPCVAGGRARARRRCRRPPPRGAPRATSPQARPAPCLSRAPRLIAPPPPQMGHMDLDSLTAADADAVAATVERAAAAYRGGQWASMVQACIHQDLSWAKPAKKWEAVLEVRGRGCIQRSLGASFAGGRGCADGGWTTRRRCVMRCGRSCRAACCMQHPSMQRGSVVPNCACAPCLPSPNSQELKFGCPKAPAKKAEVATPVQDPAPKRAAAPARR